MSCSCGSCDGCKAGRARMGKYLLGVIAVAVIALLTVGMLTAQGGVKPKLAMDVLAPGCDENAAVFVQLTDGGPIVDAQVDILLDGTFTERLRTDSNGRFFTVLQQAWCDGEHTVTARFNGDRSHDAITITTTIKPPMNTLMGEKGAVNDASADPSSASGNRLSARISQLQQSVVKIEMPGSRGSGVILRHEDGQTIIVTNKHVIEPAKRKADISVISADHSTTVPSAIYTSPQSMDLAIVVLDGVYGAPARIEAGEYLPGDDVIALGSPKGIQGSVSKGIISNLGEDRAPGGYKHQTIQTDTAINHGNSGGGLFLASTGALIGINTFQMKNAEGLNFAIDIHELERLPDFRQWQEFS